MVVFAEKPDAAAYADERRLPFPVLIDTERELFRAYGMERARWWQVWGPKTWLAYGKALLSGAELRRSNEDVRQQGGDVLIDPNGTVRLHHVGEGPADRPDIESVLELVRARVNAREG